MRSLIVLALTLLVSSYSVHGAVTGNSGIKYRSYRYNNNTSINVLTIDPNKLKILAARAQDVGAGLHTVADIGKHFSALAAINGGFFRLKDQASGLLLPAGVLKINNQWHGIAYKARGAIGWDPDSNLVLMDILQTDSKIKINNKLMPINAINTILGINRASLFSDSYLGNIIVKQNLAVLINNKQITNVYEGGEVKIQPGAYLYYANGNIKQQIGALQIGDAADLQIQIIPQLNTDTAELWNNLPFIVGGGPLLISNNIKLTDFSKEKMLDQFISGKYARTAVGILSNKQLVFVVTEQELSPEAVGLSIPELAEFMQSLGCAFAVNLDGGGSSAMYAVGQNLSPGRPVADALLVLERD